MISTSGYPDFPNAGLNTEFHSYEFYDQLTFVVPEPVTNNSELIVTIVFTSGGCCRTGSLRSCHEHILRLVTLTSKLWTGLPARPSRRLGTRSHWYPINEAAEPQLVLLWDY